MCTRITCLLISCNSSRLAPELWKMKCFGFGPDPRDESPGRWHATPPFSPRNKPPRPPSAPSVSSYQSNQPTILEITREPASSTRGRASVSPQRRTEPRPKSSPVSSSLSPGTSSFSHSSKPSSRKLKTFPGLSMQTLEREVKEQNARSHQHRASITHSPSRSNVNGKGVGHFTLRITQALSGPSPKNSVMEKKGTAREAVPKVDMLVLEELQRSSEVKHFTYAELRAATRNFSKDVQLGSGGFGRVYKGLIKVPVTNDDQGGEGKKQQKEVAIKRLDSKSLQGHKEWMMELSVLGMISHPHLVKLLGFCADGERRLLVYEFLPNSSLDRFLFRTTRQPLDWATRMKIAIGTAKGLMHLHELMEPPIIFRDFKTSNVLLDEDFNPRLSDFGLAREGPSGDDTHVSTQVRGTVGYAAPEYMLTGHLTPKNDVWSFGVVLLELLTGRQSIDQSRPKNEANLVQFSRPYLQDVNNVVKIMDPRLDRKFQPRAVAKVAETARWCLQSNPSCRPIMSEVVQVLSFLSTSEWTELSDHD